MKIGPKYRNQLKNAVDEERIIIINNNKWTQFQNDGMTEEERVIQNVIKENEKRQNQRKRKKDWLLEGRNSY